MTTRLSPLDPPQQLELQYDERLPQIPDKAHFRIDEAADLIGCRNRQVGLLIEDGTLLAVDVSRKSPLDPDSVRRHRRIPRASLLQFLNERRTV